jgi:putative spermidine/putrescine transport system substrate-binding protein
MDLSRSVGATARILFAAGCAVVIGVTGGIGVASAQERPVMNVASLGGQLDEVFKRVFKPFEEEKKITIRWTPSVSAENLAKIAASKGRPEFDIAIVENVSHYLGSTQGLWAPIDETIVKNYKDLFPQAKPKNNDGVGVGFFLAGFFYRADEFQKLGWAPPKSWNDLFRPEFCGKIGMLHPNVSYMLHTVLMLGGGEAAKARDGIAKLAKLKDCVPVLEPSAPKLEEKIQLGEYVIGIHGNIRTVYLIKRGFPIKFQYPEEGTVAAFTVAAPVKNSPNPRLAQEFADWFIRPDVQKEVMEGLFYGPSNNKVVVSDEMKSYGVPDAELMKKMVYVDDSEVVTQRRDWVRLIERAMAK